MPGSNRNALTNFTGGQTATVNSIRSDTSPTFPCPQLSVIRVRPTPQHFPSHSSAPNTNRTNTLLNPTNTFHPPCRTQLCQPSTRSASSSPGPSGWSPALGRTPTRGSSTPKSRARSSSSAANRNSPPSTSTGALSCRGYPFVWCLCVSWFLAFHVFKSQHARRNGCFAMMAGATVFFLVCCLFPIAALPFQLCLHSGLRIGSTPSTTPKTPGWPPNNKIWNTEATQRICNWDV